MCASQWVLNKPGGEMKVQAGGGRPHSGSPSPAGGAHRRPAAFHLWKWRSLSPTRWDPKDGELCPDRTRPEKLWWRSVAVLTCKSIVRSGSSGGSAGGSQCLLVWPASLTSQLSASGPAPVPCRSIAEINFCGNMVHIVIVASGCGWV
ncbi:hypothetical protein JTE90_019911 [Oedothorax gibbosus]|uniref:Uncharacterized protein n=1 Tax=Oedothorax gibbosus TaxID=931172 RepID=A0AAV6TFE9_9ARAC|nr:hypothetical protein JTE90_019911 [Oedothorax gibbosus]